MNELSEQATTFVMEFYSVSRDEALSLYLDEVHAYMRLMEMKNERTN